MHGSIPTHDLIEANGEWVRGGENVPLAPYTTLGIGGPARWFVEVIDESGMLSAIRLARSQGLPLFILGGGSNILVSDEGFPGVVIHVRGVGIPSMRESDGIAEIASRAGTPWDHIVHTAAFRNWAGIECLAGIPGCVGGTPVQNVGAYGQEVSNSIFAVRAFDLEALKAVFLPANECGFAYRRSIFNTTQRGRYAITHVIYRLKVDQPAHLAYRDVQHYFAERGIAHPTLNETADAVRIIRARKGMLLDPDDPDSRSAGSFFKNPIVPAALVPRVAASANCRADEVPQFPPGAESTPADAMVKLSAAWLIERAGFHKGFTLGSAGLSTKHVLAIVNLGDATAAEIIALRDTVTAEVYARFGIRLEQEPVMLGFPPSNPTR